MAEVASDLAASLACPVCLELPAGEGHQCFEGHCYCVDCWRRLCHPRRCPECRDPIPLRNRSRAQEARVAALPAVCDHCDHTTTRGAMAEHLRACQQRPTTCTAAAKRPRSESLPSAHSSSSALIERLFSWHTTPKPISGTLSSFDGRTHASCNLHHALPNPNADASSSSVMTMLYPSLF